jgi:hypothetical protein
MMVNYAPIKTEYKGIVFDSKSEAVFARAMDLAKGHNYNWKYHPTKHPNDIMNSYFLAAHEWDFGIYTTHTPSPMCVPIEELYVEYKPKKPTDTYIKNLKKRVYAIPESSFPESLVMNTPAMIVYGNPWDGPQNDGYSETYLAEVLNATPGTFYHYRNEINKMLGITEAMAQEAKQYRFDLKQ